MITKIKAFLKKYWIFILLSLLATVLIVISLVPKLPSKPTEELIPAPQYSWHQVEPGKSTEAEIKEKVGNPLKETQIPEGKILEYASGYQYYPDKVYISNNTTSLIKEKVTYERNLNLSSFVEQYGKSSLIMYEKDLGETYPFNVFSNQGIAIAAHIGTGRIIEIWYFKPITEQEFLQTIGKELMKIPSKQF